VCLTVIERGNAEEVLFGRIDGVDIEALQVGICVGVKRYATFDVEGAEFSVEPGRVVATRDDLEWLIFEED
jgi:hypothetical protein